MMKAQCMVGSHLSKEVAGGITSLGSHIHRTSLKETRNCSPTVQLLLGGGAGSRGGEERERELASHFYPIFDFHQVRCYLSTSKQIHGDFVGLPGCPSGDLLCSAFTQRPSKCLPIPQLETPSWTSSLLASGDGLCHFQTACQKRTC